MPAIPTPVDTRGSADRQRESNHLQSKRVHDTGIDDMKMRAVFVIVKHANQNAIKATDRGHDGIVPFGDTSLVQM